VLSHVSIIDCHQTASKKIECLPITHALVQKGNVPLPKVCNDLQAWLSPASKRDEQQEITFPQEKHRTGMIIVASLLGADLKS
jgi:hypothetical protein